MIFWIIVGTVLTLYFFLAICAMASAEANRNSKDGPPDTISGIEFNG